MEVIEEEDDALYQDLESKGFFDSTDSASSKSSPTRQNPNSKMRPLPSASRRLEMVQGLQSGGGGGHSQHKLEMGHFPELPPMPSLEDIIREIPDETSEGLNGVEAKAFLNRPESELSVKALKPPSPEPPADLKDVETSDGQHREPKLPREAEMGVDRMFSRQLHLQLGSGAGANAGRAGVSEGKQFTMDTGLRLNEAAVRQLALLPTITEIVYKDQTRNIHGGEGPLLLRGTDSKHVRYVESLSDKVGDLLYAEELLPADAKSFDKIRRRLQHTGNFGAIGVQLLDIIGACWLKDTPPSTADIVDQLTDHVTETEL